MDIDKIKQRYQISSDLHDKYDVYKGLRNKNGSGVLVGLSRVGGAHGYDVYEGQRIPVEGELFYRGISVKDIIVACRQENRFGFEEVIYLILFGALPTAEQLKNFSELLRLRRNIAEKPFKLIKRIYGDDIINKVQQGILICRSFSAHPKNSAQLKDIIDECINIIAYLPVLVAHLYNKKSFLPDENKNTAENFLYMLKHDVTESEARALDAALMLHAEFGGSNNSSFTVHVLGSAGTGIHSAIVGAISSLKGTKHGGASKATVDMIDDIKRNIKDWNNRDEVKDYLIKIINKKANDKSGLIYGVGHAEFTLSDPRTLILKEQTKILAKEKGRMNEWELYALIEELAPIAFFEAKGKEKAICANVDFYSGFLYDLLGIPMELCVAMFAISRIVGWCSHFIDEHINGGKIIHPTWLNVQEKMEYTPLSKRKA